MKKKSDFYHNITNFFIIFIYFIYFFFHLLNNSSYPLYFNSTSAIQDRCGSQFPLAPWSTYLYMANAVKLDLAIFLFYYNKPPYISLLQEI